MHVTRALCACTTATLLAGCAHGAPTKDEALQSYLSSVVAEQQRYERTRTHVVDALTSASEISPDASWTQAARRLRVAELEYNDLVVRLDSIAPPAELRAQHAGMVRSLRLYKLLVDNLQRPLSSRDVIGLGRTLATTTKLGVRATQLRIRWRVAAEADARELGVVFPPTLEHVGSDLGERTDREQPTS